MNHSFKLISSNDGNGYGKANSNQKVDCRLLYLIGELHTGGSEWQLYHLLRAMDRDRYKPAVAVWNYSESDFHLPLIRELSVPVYALPRNASRVTKLTSLRRLVKQLNPEVI